MKRFIAMLSLVCVLSSGCAAPAPPVEEPQASLDNAPLPVNQAIPTDADLEQSITPLAAAPSSLPTPQAYIRQVAQDAISKFATLEMSEYEKVKAAFDYLIETSYYTSPVALDVWRWRSSGEGIPSYVENRSLSILLYGLGTCEDYSAALVMLLEGMGIEAQYIPGLTYTTEGYLCDHAWVVAKVDGVWYHLDCELEDGISRNNTVRYRFFMKSDASMRASHFWGQNLIDSGRLQADQVEEIRQSYIPPACPQDYPTPAAYTFTSAPQTDEDAVTAALLEELREYEAVYGTLAPMEINRVPPVFGRYGGHNRDVLSWYDAAAWQQRDRETVLIR